MALSITDFDISGSSGTVQYSGLTSDINWGALVDDLVEIERTNINRLEEWKSEWEEKNTVISNLESRLLTLESIAGDLNAEYKFYQRTSASSDEDVVVVSNTDFAQTGAHSITVGSNIPHVLGSQIVDDSTAAVGTIADTNYDQDLVISMGENSFTVDYVAAATESNGEFDANSSLEDLVTAINNAAGNTYVTASILEDSGDADGYRLLLTADTGGDDNQISVTGNPLNLNFNTSHIGNTVETTWTGATATADGTSTVAEDRTYTFTAAASGTVGQSGSLLINWSDDDGNSGTLEVGSDYTAGTALTVADGMTISLGSGSITNGEEFRVNAYANVLTPGTSQMSSGSATPESGGHYTGDVNNKFEFKVLDSGTLGSDAIDISWKDAYGNTDTLTIPATYSSGEAITVYQGVTVAFDTSASSSLTAGDTFTVHVTTPTIQAGQDDGLARVEIQTHAGFPDDLTTAVTTTQGTFSYTYNGTSRALTVPANATLDDLADLINNDEDNPGVTASIVNDGSGLSTAYHLQLTGEDSGAAFGIKDISDTLTSFDTGNFQETQNAQNAMVKIDNYPSDDNEYLQRSSNTINDVISGVTLSLMDTGDATITISNDTAAIKESIQNFVDAVNDVMDYIKAMTARIEQGDETYKGPMIGNYTFQIIQQRINSILAGSVSGLSGDDNEYTVLSQIGITTEYDQLSIDYNDATWTKTARRWEIDTATLTTALNSNIEDVGRLFINDTQSGVQGIAELIRAEAEALTNEYVESDRGILSVLEHNYNNIIDNIDKKIAREETRVAMVEERLNTKYAALEALLGELAGQEESLASITDQLNNND
ncbi:MAG: flagellar filament capping protein FliD [Thermodesulfobacteriota bacterium]|nr:flagellar filament capping protein FliD [Thermodesulfobacteriota bacterium]